MDRTTTRRRTTTRTTTRASGASEVRDRLTSVASELDRVVERERREADELAKIRSMLDPAYINELLKQVEDLEVQMEEIEESRLSAESDRRAMQGDLDTAERRLKELWDAYKAQEDELNEMKRQYPLLEEKLYERERTVEELTRENQRLAPLERIKEDYDLAVRENHKLNDEIEELEAIIKRLEDRVDDLQGEVQSLHSLRDDLGKMDQLERELAHEQDRLEALLGKYKELEATNNEVEALLAQWEKWFKATETHMRGVCKSLDRVPN